MQYSKRWHKPHHRSTLQCYRLLNFHGRKNVSTVTWSDDRTLPHPSKHETFTQCWFNVLAERLVLAGIYHIIERACISMFRSFAACCV